MTASTPLLGIPLDNTVSINPSMPHPAYHRMKPLWVKCRALLAGSDQVRALGTDILPQMEGESDDAYAVRNVIAALHPGFAKAIDVTVGLMLAQEPVLGADCTQPLLDFWEDVDGAETHGALFCLDLVTSAAVDGIAGIFTDFTRVDGPPLSADEEQRLGARPYWMLVRADDQYLSVYQTIHGKRVLVLFVRREMTDELIEPFGVRTTTRFRVYRLHGHTVTCQTWLQPYGSATSTPDGAPVVLANQTRIPWSPLRAGQRVSEVETRPPFLQLADTVIQYHQLLTNMLSLMSLGCVPTQVRIGAQPDEHGQYPPITLGPRSTIEAPYLQGLQRPVYWDSPDVTVLDPAEKALVRTEAAMALASQNFLSPEKRGAETAKSKQISQRATNATIATFARRLQDCLETALDDVASFLRIPGGSIRVNTDFENALMEPAAMLAYVALVNQGFPKRLALEALQLGGRIPADEDLEQIELEWESAVVASQQAAADAAAATAAEMQAGGTVPTTGPAPLPVAA